MRYLMLSMITVFFVSAHASAQTKTRLITGLVTAAEDGSRLEGTAVWVKGTKNYSGSQPDGIYYIPIKNSDSVLVFSREGYDPQELRLNHETEYNIQLSRALVRKENKPVKRR